jgi:hypothetical protein
MVRANQCADHQGQNTETRVGRGPQHFSLKFTVYFRDVFSPNSNTSYFEVDVFTNERGCSLYQPPGPKSADLSESQELTR